MTISNEFKWPEAPKAFVIYNPTTNKYSVGGTTPFSNWGSKMKIWKSLGNINSHLSLLREGKANSKRPENLYKDCVVLDLIKQEIVPWSKLKIDLKD